MEKDTVINFIHAAYRLHGPLTRGSLRRLGLREADIDATVNGQSHAGLPAYHFRWGDLVVPADLSDDDEGIVELLMLVRPELALYGPLDLSSDAAQRPVNPLYDHSVGAPATPVPDYPGPRFDEVLRILHTRALVDGAVIIDGKAHLTVDNGRATDRPHPTLGFVHGSDRWKLAQSHGVVSVSQLADILAADDESLEMPAIHAADILAADVATGRRRLVWDGCPSGHASYALV